MFRLILFFGGIIMVFGWMTGMVVYKVLQIVFTLVAIIILMLVGNFLMVMLNKN